ncbi:MAG: DUF421 domain-containing protein [Planctomycetes bacterium]|nr:DUF421 domain-containing protein [Planctomycetota bacterium]
MYLALFALLRVIPRRQAGTLGITDLLLVTLLADAAQNGMAGGYKSIPDGILLVTTIISWNYALDWLAFKSDWMRRLIEPAPLTLVKNGRLQHKHMRQELITKDELMGQLREQGILNLEDVAEARIENDGHVSVIKTKDAKGQ